VSDAVTATWADDINDGLSMLLVLLFVVGCVRLLSSVCGCVCGWCVVCVVASALDVCVSVAVTAIVPDEINDGLSLLMVLLFVVGCACVY
jgi:hypothetical protein